MKTAQTTQSAPSTDSTNPSNLGSEAPPLAIECRIGLAMFLMVGFLFGVILLWDLLSGFFR